MSTAVDADEELLRFVARQAGVAVRINSRERERGRDFVELYERGPSRLQLGVFRNPPCAVAWLRGRAPIKPAVDRAKRESTLRAVAALAGFELERLADGSFVIERWNLVRPLRDLDAVEAFLDHVGAAR